MSVNIKIPTSLTGDVQLVAAVDGNPADPNTGEAASGSPYKCGSPYKSYVALLNQSLDQFYNEDLVIGKKYTISRNDPDTEGLFTDFTTVGATSNDPETEFTATGTSVVWLGHGRLIRDYDPVATILNGLDDNFIGDIVWTRVSYGNYKGVRSIPFQQNKTFVNINKTFPYPAICAHINEDGDVIVTSFSVSVAGTEILYTPGDSVLQFASIIINEYQ